MRCSGGVGVFSDTHGNITALRAVLADGHERGVTRWACLGDIAFKGPAPEECLALIRSLGDAADVVMGNTEEWLPVGPHATEGKDEAERAAVRTWWEWTIPRLSQDSLTWLRSLRPTREVVVGADRLLCVHATPRHLEEQVLPWAQPGQVAEAFGLGRGASAHTMVACGHVHLSYLRVIDGKTVFNPGSAGRPIDGDPRASYAIIWPDGGSRALEFRRVAYDIDEITALAHQVGFPWAEVFEDAIRKGQRF